MKFNWRIVVALVSTIILLYIIIDQENIYDYIYQYEIAGNITNFSTNLLDNIHVDCEGIKSLDPHAISTHRYGVFRYSKIEQDLLHAENRCAAYQSMFDFNDRPLSREEADYPLAYGLLVYTSPLQVLLMMSSFYHPQNEYCLAVSGNASPNFKSLIHSFGDCYPNIHIIDIGDVKWAGYEILNGLYKCFDYLSKHKTQWKYYQYLSGTDVPLRTNLEMVRAFQAMGGAVNVEITDYQANRLVDKKLSDSPLPLLKASMSSLVPRAAADKICNSAVVRDLLVFLNDTEVADEAFWATVLGNLNAFPVSGGIDGQQFNAWRKIVGRTSTERARVQSARDLARPDWNYYISRYQQWNRDWCYGRVAAGSCVFGVESVAILLQQPHFVAHKLYIDYQPAALFCMLKEVRHRSLHPLPFDTTLYSQLPQVELVRGVPIHNLTHPHWLL